LPELEKSDLPFMTGSSAITVGSVRAQVAGLLIRMLSEQCESYCILTGYEELPEKFGSDIN
jgi:hypothetical protein